MSQETHAKSHDGFFKLVLQDRAAATELMQFSLPAEVVDAINWQSLRLTDTHHVTDDLKESISDIVYSGSFKTGEACQFCCVIEHFSHPGKRNITFKTHGYTVAAIEKNIDPMTKLAPVVFTMVFYHSERPFPYKSRISDYFPAAYRQLGEHYLLNSMQLIDVSKIPDQILASMPHIGLMALLQKHIFDEDILAAMLAILRIIKQQLPHFVVGDSIPTEAILEYVVAKGKTEQPVTRVRESLIEIFEGENMYIADILKEEGRQEGLQEGRQEGWQQGLQEGWQAGQEEGIIQARQEMAKALLRQGMEIKLVAKVSKLPLQALRRLRQQIQAPE